MKNTGRRYAKDSSRSTLRCRSFIGLLCWCAVLTASTYAQQRSVSNFDDINNVGSQTISNIQRSSGVVTAILNGNLTVPGGNKMGLINVTISAGDTSFAGTNFVVQSGSNTSTLTWNQSGPNTGVLNVTGTVIATGWGLCLGGPCAGGNAPTSTLQTFANATPSIPGSGGSMLLQETGSDSNSSGTGSNTGWFYNAGASTTATSFILDLQFNVPDNTNIQALEFDQFQYLKGIDTKVFFGTECDTGHNWRVWDQFKGVTDPPHAWIDTGQPCSYVVSSTGFNRLRIAVHRVAGDTSCSFTTPVQFTGPAMHYDSITIYNSNTPNGTVVVSNQTTCSGPPSSGEEPITDQTGLFIQLDTKDSCKSGCTISEYIDQGSFLASDTGGWWPAVQSLLLK